MNEQTSLAFSVQPDGTASYALSITDDTGTRAINLSSLGADTTDIAFIAAVNAAIANYRTDKGF